MKLTPVMASSTVPGAAVVIFASTLVVDSRPWWHIMQRASVPRSLTVVPEGNFTDVSAAVASLWQASQVITWPIGWSAGVAYWVPVSPT
jgi:hypothetical protein